MSESEPVHMLSAPTCKAAASVPTMPMLSHAVRLLAAAGHPLSDVFPIRHRHQISSQ